MARITTTTRLIVTKETVKEIYEKLSHQWIELTETSYAEKMNGDRVLHESSIHINKDFIVEMYD